MVASPAILCVNAPNGKEVPMSWTLCHGWPGFCYWGAEELDSILRLWCLDGCVSSVSKRESRKPTSLSSNIERTITCQEEMERAPWDKAP